jgi:hypothetical protein
MLQRIYWWRKKLEQSTKALPKAENSLALLPVQVTKPTAPARARGEPVMVMLRSGHVIKVGRGFDEEAFARVMAVMESA